MRRNPQKKPTLYQHLRSAVIVLVFLTIIIAQAFYWVYANMVYPMVLGLPFGMFMVLLLIGVEFLALLVLYLVELKNNPEEEGES